MGKRRTILLGGLTILLYGTGGVAVRFLRGGGPTGPLRDPGAVPAAL